MREAAVRLVFARTDSPRQGRRAPRPPPANALGSRRASRQRHPRPPPPPSQPHTYTHTGTTPRAWRRRRGEPGTQARAAEPERPWHGWLASCCVAWGARGRRPPQPLCPAPMHTQANATHTCTHGSTPTTRLPWQGPSHTAHPRLAATPATAATRHDEALRRGVACCRRLRLLLLRTGACRRRRCSARQLAGAVAAVARGQLRRLPQQRLWRGVGGGRAYNPRQPTSLHHVDARKRIRAAVAAAIRVATTTQRKRESRAQTSTRHF
jgi:hypothetical protein